MLQVNGGISLRYRLTRGLLAAALACGLSLPVQAQPVQIQDSESEAPVAAATRGRVIVTADPRVLQQARQLLAEKKAEEVYQLLSPREYEWAGDRDFDYLLGAAAVDTGRNSEAVLALQRSLATDPSYSAARMELGRAYYNLGDYDQAAGEFRQLQLESPPDYARRAIENYLLAIDKRKAGTGSGGPNFQYFVEFDFGYDTNANGSTGDDTFLGFELDDNNVEQDSFFVGFSHGGIWTNPLTSRLTNYNQFSFNHRRNFSADFVNADRLSLASSCCGALNSDPLSGGLRVQI